METEIRKDESVSMAIVRAVCAVEGREPGSLRPLAQVFDPDALDNIFDSRPDGEPRIGGHLSFIYSNSRVSVDNGEYLTIQPLEYQPRSPDDRKLSSPELPRRPSRESSQ